MENFIKKVRDKKIRDGLKYSIYDGILWAIMFGLGENYIIPFALAIGATALQVSFISASGQLAVSVSQIIGANFIQKYKKRKKLAIFCNKIHALSWVFIFFISYITKNPDFIIPFYFIGLASTNFAGPGWLSWMNDIVPAKLRGEFWGVRNKLIGLMQFLSICVAGILLHFFSKDFETLMITFGVLFNLAFLARYLSIIPLGKQYEPEMAVSKKSLKFTFVIFLKKLSETNFGRFVLFSIFMTLAVNIMAPLVPVFLLKSLKYNYFEYMVVILSAMVSSFLSMTYWGPLSDKYGNYRIIVVTAIGLPFISLGWAFFKNFYLLIFIQIFSGFIWSGFNIATLNFIFDAVKRENIPKISAYFNLLNNILAFLGSTLGGVLTKFLPEKEFSFLNFAPHNYEIIFLISAFLRILVILLFIRAFKEVRKFVESSPPFHHFYVYGPFINIINKISLLLPKEEEKINKK